MKRFPILVVSVVVAMICALGVGPSRSARATASVSFTWSIVPSPNVGSGTNRLNAVAVVSATDAWAVGSAGGQTLTERWDGTEWSVIPAPTSDRDGAR